MRRLTRLRTLRNIARVVLLLVAGFWFVFALLSGSEEYGGGIRGVIMNSPNALPWVLLFILVYVVWRWEITGGLLITAMGVFTIFFFHSWRHLIVFFGVSVALIVLGLIFVAHGYYDRQHGT